MPLMPKNIQELKSLIGQELNVGDWIMIDQDKIDTHARTTGDADWLHNDPVRAAQDSPYDRQTIAQGFLLLAHLSNNIESMLVLPSEIAYSLNYGFNRIRFISPVKVGSRIRRRISLKDVSEKPPEGYVLTFDAIIEIEGSDKPAALAEWLGMLVKKKSDNPVVSPQEAQGRSPSDSGPQASGWKGARENLLFYHLEKWAGIRPESEALVFEDERLTYRQFNDQADLIAKAFLEFGVQKGDCVGLLSMARNEFMTTYLAAAKVGAMWLGLNPKSTADELRYLFQDCRPKVLITVRRFMDQDLAQIIIRLQKELPFIEKVLVLGEPFEGAESFKESLRRNRAHLDEALARRKACVTPEDRVLLVYTSGSTGNPKGVVHTHATITEDVRVEVPALRMNEDMRALMHFPINHFAASVDIGFATLFAGGCLVFMDRFDPAASLEIIEKERLTLFGQLPTMFILQMQQPAFHQVDMSSLKMLVFSGAPANQTLLDVLIEICRKTGAGLATGYGSTEAGWPTFTAVNDRPERLLNTVGRVHPPFELKIVDDRRNPLGSGQIGEIAIRGPQLFKEYLNKPEATAKVLDQEGWYYTDDLAHVDEDGYVYLSGRKSERFRSGGENVFPKEIENVLETHPAVWMTAVIGAKDPVYQEVGWAFVMPKPGLIVGEEELRALCKAKLSNFRIPKRFFFRPELPLLPNGKVNKMALKKEMETI
jgi:acyl-CoA synthetase (AMP-forming)/AMP-acid ligase II/acyl dehydratase